ncbi:MAG: LysR substrate-binding domain-containing protein [Comamonadaceae bacterium]|nr:LysR substrate-binding domain-containing protein [Comamonadaceae bacterium]
MRVDDGQGIVAALCADLGLCQLPGYMVADEIADGRLVELLPERRPPPLPIGVIHPSGRAAAGAGARRTGGAGLDGAGDDGGLNLFRAAPLQRRLAARGVPGGAASAVASATQAQAPRGRRPAPSPARCRSAAPAPTAWRGPVRARARDAHSASRRGAAVARDAARPAAATGTARCRGRRSRRSPAAPAAASSAGRRSRRSAADRTRCRGVKYQGTPPGRGHLRLPDPFAVRDAIRRRRRLRRGVGGFVAPSAHCAFEILLPRYAARRAAAGRVSPRARIGLTITADRRLVRERPDPQPRRRHFARPDG